MIFKNLNVSILGLLMYSTLVTIFTIFGCCQRKDISPLSVRINNYIKKNCIKNINCFIPENIYFINDEYDQVLIIEDLYDSKDIPKSVIDLKKIDLNGTEGTVKGFRIWLLIKGNKLYKYYKEQDLMMCNIPYPLNIKWEIQMDKNTKSRIYKVKRGINKLYADMAFNDENNTTRASIYAIE